ncbi:MAG: methyltransferase domain-containing protein [Alistipes sp.]|nr:methyltransferase domain-containing protein [Alistipes sp.]
MTHEEKDILLREEVRKAIDANIERDPVRIALDRNIPYAREVATQVKYLQRARTKLPMLYDARCIIPQRAFEQSSSQQCAAAKRIGGESLLDLTCGLGIDSIAFAQRFKRVVAIERDEVLAEVVRENLKRLNITNIEVATSSAEDYLASCNEHFDWVYADPDRRTAEGRRVVRLEDCSPNMLELWPAIEHISKRVAIKNSPLFDVDEAFRLFGDCSVEVISLGGECKEVMIYVDGDEPRLVAEAVGVGRYEVSRDEALKATLSSHNFTAEEYRYLIVPDVALQKARLTASALQGKADIWSNNSFGFARQKTEGVLGRTEKIVSVEEYDSKALRRELKGKGVDIMMRDFPTSLDEVRRKCGLRSGNAHRIALTRIGGKYYTIWLE